MSHSHTTLGTLGSPLRLSFWLEWLQTWSLFSQLPRPFLCEPYLEKLLKMGFPGRDARGKPAAPACASSSSAAELSPALLSLDE